MAAARSEVVQAFVSRFRFTLFCPLVFAVFYSGFTVGGLISVEMGWLPYDQNTYHLWSLFAIMGIIFLSFWGLVVGAAIDLGRLIKRQGFGFPLALSGSAAALLGAYFTLRLTVPAIFRFLLEDY